MPAFGAGLPGRAALAAPTVFRAPVEGWAAALDDRALGRLSSVRIDRADALPDGSGIYSGSRDLFFLLLKASILSISDSMLGK